jgi:hypothetical protein
MTDLSGFALAGVELVHKRPGPSVEAHDRGDVPGPEEELRSWRSELGNGASAHEQASDLRARRRPLNSIASCIWELGGAFVALSSCQCHAAIDPLLLHWPL